MLCFKSFIRTDSEGNGNFGSSRGTRIHNGVDFAVVPGLILKSPVAGKVTKLGYPYQDDLSYRYIEITDAEKRKHRFFYVEPLAHVKVGMTISIFSDIGEAQNVSKRYSDKMIPHVHYEIKMPDGSFINPMEAVFGDGNADNLS